MSNTSLKPKITIVLLNYKRPQNIPIILNAIKSQSIKATVFLWNNGTTDVNSSLIDRYETSSNNTGCMARWKLAQRATTPYVMSLDDDICLNGSDAIKKIVQSIEAQTNSNTIVGAFGACFSKNLKYNIRKEFLCRYRDSHDQSVQSMVDTHRLNNDREMVFVKRTFIDQDKSVDMIKGRCMIFRKKLLDNLEFPEEREDDIFLNGLFSKGQRNFHCVAKLLDDTFYELPEHGTGNWLSQGHFQSRTRALQTYFSNTDFDDE